MRDVSAHPDRIRHLLEVFTERLRHMDDMVMALAFSPKRKRLEFALGLARLRTIPDRKHAGQQVFKGEPSDLASSAAVDEAEARRFLDRASEKRGAEVFAEDDSVSALGNSVAHLAGGAARRVSTPAPRTLVAIGPPFFWALVCQSTLHFVRPELKHLNSLFWWSFPRCTQFRPGQLAPQSAEKCRVSLQRLSHQGCQKP